MRKVFLLFICMCFASMARAQTGTIVLSVTASPTPIIVNQNCNYVVIQENSANPTNSFTITLPGQTTGITYPAGAKFIFTANSNGYINGQLLGNITVSSGTVQFIGIESIAAPTLPASVKTGGGGGLTFVSSLPPLCAPGVTPSVQLSVPPYAIYYCSATNTWTQVATGGGSPPGGILNQVQFNNGAGGFAGGPLISTVSITPTTADAIQFVTPEGNDSNNGFSWGTSKLTIMAAYDALPSNGGTIYFTAGVSPTSTAGQGIWICGNSDTACFASPPAGWRLQKGGGIGVRFYGIASGGDAALLNNCGSQADQVHPCIWISGTNAPMHFQDMAYQYPNRGIIIGCTAAGACSTSAGGVAGVTFTNVVGHINAGVGNGPNARIGSNSFWIVFDHCSLGGNFSEQVGISTVARSSNVTTVTTSSPFTVTQYEHIGIVQASDATFNGSFQVATVTDSTHFTIANNGPDVSTESMAATVITDKQIPLVIDPWDGNTEGAGSGLIFANGISNGNFYSAGGIRLHYGTGGGGVYASDLTVEGNLTNVTASGVWVDAIGGVPWNVRANNIEMADGVGTPPYYGLQVDCSTGCYTKGLADNFIATKVQGVLGPATDLGSGIINTSDTITPLRRGQQGFLAGTLVGQSDAARRLFTNGFLPYGKTNLANTTASTWTNSGGTLTAGIADPIAGTNSAQIAGSGGSLIITGGTVTPTANDIFIAGVWVRSVTGNGYGNSAAFRFDTNASGSGTNNECSGSLSAQQSQAQRLVGDGQWEFYWTVCKLIKYGGSNAGLQMVIQSSSTQTVQAFAPSIFWFPSGTISDNESYELANNLGSWSSVCVSGQTCDIVGPIPHLNTNNVFTAHLTDAGLQTTGTIASALCQDASGNFITSASANCFAATGSGVTLQTNGTNNASQATLNLINSAAFNGLTGTFTNTGTGVVQFGFTGTLGNSGLTNPATTVNSQTCTLGSTCTIPFQTNTTNNTSQAGLNFLTSTANAVGLTVTPTNSATNAMKFEVTGTAFTGTAANLAGCTPSTSGDICVWNGSAWARIAGNSSGTNWLQETSGGAASWTTPAGTINSASQYAMPYYSGAGTSTVLSGVAAPVVPNGVPETWISIPSSGAATLGQFSLAGVPVNNNGESTCATQTLNVLDRASAIFCSGTSTSTFTFPVHTTTGFAFNFPLIIANNNSGTMTLTPTTDTIDNSNILPGWAMHIFNNAAGNWQTIEFPQIAAFGSTCTNGLTWSTSTGIGCLSNPNGTVTSFSAGNLSPLFTTSVATATTTPALTFSLSNAAAGTVLGNATGSAAGPTYTATPVLGVSGTAGTLSLFPASGNFKTILGSAATATNTVNFFATTPTTTDLIECVTSSTTCTLTDSGIPITSSTIPIANVGSSGLSGTSPISITSAGAISVAGAAGEMLAGATPALTYTPTLGVSGTAGMLSMFPASGNFTTTWGSGATASNTILGFAAVPVNTDIITCAVSSTTCTLTDSGIAVTSNKIAISAVGTSGLSGTSPISISSAGAISVAGAAGEILAGATPALTYTPTLGVSGTAGTISLFPASGNFTTTLSSGATASNTVKFFATAPTTNHLVSCVTSSTTCTLTDSGILDTATGLLAAATGGTGPLLVTGVLDGDAPITITTGTTATLGAATYQSGYTFNQEGTAGTGVTYTLPVIAVGMQYCVANSIVSGTGAANTGVLTVYPQSGNYVILNGTRNTVGGGGTHGVASGGAAADAACFVAIDANDWTVYVQKGTWTEN